MSKLQRYEMKCNIVGCTMDKDQYGDFVLADDAEAEIARLWEAIHEHRDNVWGERRGIYHDEDMELYAVLDEREET